MNKQLTTEKSFQNGESPVYMARDELSRVIGIPLLLIFIEAGRVESCKLTVDRKEVVYMEV